MTGDRLTPPARAVLDEEVRRKRRHTRDDGPEAPPPQSRDDRHILRVQHADGSVDDFAIPPPESPFRRRLKAARMRASWDLLNGRFFRRPLRHRLPPEPFRSKHRERQDEHLQWMLAKLALPRRPRPPRLPKEPSFWWGSFARMRVPASRGMAELNREFHRMPAEEEDEEC
ncbi:hypothetical protein E2C06_33190 [Dankookia rubra]|uniref:Uncharacterized protein n=1 Tax=Dankookia rubra TaxID=1442381 RepID=A0A4R5Q795_9PROT|nr:hypothetical protein [Dankookia rubra]TDH58318.1 hypothetical protein E2C06_33190 [Dankookia rubra]